MPSRGYTSSARVSSHPGAYVEIPAADFGVVGGGAQGVAPAIAYNAAAGSLAMSTARAAITWITTQGESGPSAETTVSIAAGSGAFTLTKPTTPTGGATVLGWRVYSSSGAAGSALLNVAANSTTQVQQNFVTAQGTLAGFPISQTTVQVLIYGAGQAEPLADFSGAQAALPSIALNTTIDYYFRVPNTNSQWKIQKSVEWMRPSGIAEPAGVLVGPMDCIAPLYPGLGASVTASIATPIYFVMNSFLFVASATGTTAAAFIGFANFNQTRYGVTTDGTVKWTCLGRASLVRCHFGNNTAASLTPATQEYDLFQV